MASTIFLNFKQYFSGQVLHTAHAYTMRQRVNEATIRPALHLGLCICKSDKFIFASGILAISPIPLATVFYVGIQR